MNKNSKFKIQSSNIKATILKSINLPLRFIPLWIEAIGMGVIMGSIIDSNKRFKERLKEIDNKVFLFDASDIKRRFYFHIKDGDIKVIPNFAGNVDVEMKGAVSTLFGLLIGKEDPDTVFFSRRLEISGDTSVAIHFKNILNSL